ncbi:peptide chain release factor 1 [Derxia gummosa]|uniref:Peptide chain release factor 1 n=1 Tax=Derxia gummosa DSM 723 TaxID=1121388 RepID=A0A8B6X5I7_9BURK|nr:peptide chain release factor 1 [Derxia gummosa]
MKASMQARLDQLCVRLSEIELALQDPAVVNDMTEYRKLTRENADLGTVVARYRDWKTAVADLAAADEMLRDPELRDFAAAEVEAARERIDATERELQTLLLPRDPNDDRPVLLEIRAGTGGDESALFAGDLLRMYLRYAERLGWRTEILSASQSELGGYREVIVRIEGDGAYSHLKFESGAHRVQRVPATEAQGRIHTSACTVAVLPEADEVDVQISPDELRIDVFRASGAGGQHINKTESAVRITHLPTGLVAECQDDRSQHRNKDKAMKVLASRLRDLRVREQQGREAATRKSLVGSGDRSERIRTYNFPQGRLTDHRINLTLYRLDGIMEGELDEVTAALRAEHQAEQLAALGQD